MATYLALFIDTNGKIRVNEFPEKPKYCYNTCRQDNMEGCEDPSSCLPWTDRLSDYNDAVQAALDNGVECEDQDIEKWKLVICTDTELWPWEVKDNTPYPIPYKMEVKKAMSCGFEGENLCALNEKDCPNHLHGTCQEKKLATLTLISNV